MTEKRLLELFGILEAKKIVKRRNSNEPPIYEVVEEKREEFNNIMCAMFDVPGDKE